MPDKMKWSWGRQGLSHTEPRRTVTESERFTEVPVLVQRWEKQRISGWVGDRIRVYVIDGDTGGGEV